MAIFVIYWERRMLKEMFGQNPSGSSIDFFDLLLFLFKRKHMIAALTVAGMIAGLVLGSQQERSYKATGYLEIGYFIIDSTQIYIESSSRLVNHIKMEPGQNSASFSDNIVRITVSGSSEQNAREALKSLQQQQYARLSEMEKTLEKALKTPPVVRTSQPDKITIQTPKTFLSVFSASFLLAMTGFTAGLFFAFFLEAKGYCAAVIRQRLSSQACI